MEKRLFRNEYDKVIAGVSSGVADYMQVDVTIIRLLFVLSTIFLFGTGILVYIVMWIVVPVNIDPSARFSKFNEYFKGNQNPSSFNSPNAFSQPHQSAEPAPDYKATEAGDTGFSGTTRSGNTTSDWTYSSMKSGNFAPKSDNSTGRTVGGLFLLVIGLYFLMNEFHIIPFWFSLGKLWPLIFVAIGVSFILKSKRHNDFEDWKRRQQQPTEKPDNTASDAEDPSVKTY